jgi:lysophosphatidylcholine acyltransferase / lyso-PAF acetyltransferase
MEALISWLWSWFTPFWIGLYLVLNALPLWYTMWSKRWLKGNPELNKQYWPFVRNDYEHWHPVSGFFLNLLYGFPFKYVSCWLIVITIFLCSSVLTIGHKKGDIVSKWRQKGIFYSTTMLFRLLILVIGVTWVTKDRRKVDYSKYLGKEYKPTFKGHGVVVCNHQSWIDILVIMHLYDFSFLSKESVRNYPWIGKIAECIQCIFIKRGDTKEKKAEAIKIVQERQILAETGAVPPMLIYPEGATTNGEALVHFNKGAFAALRPVQPVVLNYWSAG